MPFLQYAYIQTGSDFFNWTVLAAVLLIQIVFGLVTPGQSHTPPYLWWFAQSLTKALAAKLDRKNRGESALFIRGALSLGFLLIVAVSTVRLSDILQTRMDFGWFVIPALVWGSINVTVPWRALRNMIGAKDLKSLSKQANGLSDLTGVRFKSSDPHTVARTAILFACVSFVRYVVAPVMIFGFFGVPFLVLYVFVAAGVGSDFVGVEGKHNYSKLRRLVVTLVEFIPARIAAFYIYLSSILTPTGHPKACLENMFDGSQSFKGASLSFAIKSFAGAAGVSLGGGLTFKDGGKISRPWVGHKSATAKAEIADIKRAFVLHVFACVFVLLTLLFMIVGI